MQRVDSEREFLSQVALFSRQLLLGGHGRILALDSTPSGSFGKSPDPGTWEGGTLMSALRVGGGVGPQFWGGTAPLHSTAGAQSSPCPPCKQNSESLEVLAFPKVAELLYSPAS